MTIEPDDRGRDPDAPRRALPEGRTAQLVNLGETLIDRAIGEQITGAVVVRWNSNSGSINVEWAGVEAPGAFGLRQTAGGIVGQKLMSGGGQR